MLNSPTLLEVCNAIRPGFECNVEMHKIPCECPHCDPVTGLYVSRIHVRLIGKRAEVCVFSGVNYHGAWIRPVPYGRAPSVRNEERQRCTGVEVADRAWIEHGVRALLPLFDLEEATAP
jgi:hypothetical protein